MAFKHFCDLPIDTFAGNTVILDVDGTLLADGASLLDSRTKETLSKLSNIADVYLCSNAESSDRLHALVAGTRAKVTTSPYKKPDPRVLMQVAHTPATCVVIGDKHLTDELLAINCGIRFLKVARIRGEKERIFVRLAYLLDAVFGKIVCSLARLLSRI